MHTNNNNKPSNPNPRNSEISNPMRRSFTGNPFSKPSLIPNPRSSFSHTPANSPSDFSRRSFVDDKENGKDQILKPVKVRSPAATSKTTKHFMSPTISASFKIAESPRKKILTERNEPVLSSDSKIHARKVTFADPLEQKRIDASFDGNGIPFPSFEDDSEIYGGENVENVVPLISMDDVSFDSPMNVNINVPLIPNNDTNLLFENVQTEHSFEKVSQEHDFVNLDPTFKLSPSVTPPVSSYATVLAPLDADPSIPPYDPKTNYLSPRPQFLHYKPKPRMERLEDSFMLGSFSDTEVTEDTQSDDSQKASEDVSSDEIVKQDDDQISETKANLPEKFFEAKELPKPRFSVRSKMVVALILLLSIAFASITITNSPGMINHAVFEDFYESYKLSEFSEVARANVERYSQLAKANFDGLAQNLHIWFTKSLSSISELISDVRGVRNLAQLQYFNLTVLHHDYDVVNQYPIFGHGEKETHSPVQEKYAASEIAIDEYFDDVSAEQYEVYEEQSQQDITTEFESALDAPEYEEVHKGQLATLLESEEQALQQVAVVEHLEAMLAQEVDASFDVEVPVQESEESLEGQSATLVEPEQALQLVEAGNSEESQTVRNEDNLSSNLEAAEFYNEVCEEGNVDTMLAQESDAKLNGQDSDADIKHSQGLDSEFSEIHTDDIAVGKPASTDAPNRENDQLLEANHIPLHMVLYFLLGAGTVIIAGATLNWSRKVKSRSKNITSSVKKLNIGSENKQISPDKPSIRNAPVEMDVVGESCPSEMSSFDKSASYSSRKVVNQSNEAISVEKKRRNNHRRESLASSDYSMGSPSYGSLTVYEKFQKGRGEEEIVTPVRRSSRIRSIATSPPA